MSIERLSQVKLAKQKKYSLGKKEQNIFNVSSEQFVKMQSSVKKKITLRADINPHIIRTHRPGRDMYACLGLTPLLLRLSWFMVIP